MAIIARDPTDPEMSKRVAEARRLLEDLNHDELSEWEVGFISNLEEEWLPKDRITENQLMKLRKIVEGEDEQDQRSRWD